MSEEKSAAEVEVYQVGHQTTRRALPRGAAMNRADSCRLPIEQYKPTVHHWRRRLDGSIIIAKIITIVEEATRRRWLVEEQRVVRRKHQGAVDARHGLAVRLAQAGPVWARAQLLCCNKTWTSS